MLKAEKTSNIEIIIWGILTGIIFVLRLNILAIFLAIFIIIGIRLLLKKEIKEILRWISLGLIGFTISIIPILIYLIKNKCLINCINCAYLNIIGRICK